MAWVVIIGLYVAGMGTLLGTWFGINLPTLPPVDIPKSLKTRFPCEHKGVYVQGPFFEGFAEQLQKHRRGMPLLRVDCETSHLAQNSIADYYDNQYKLAFTYRPNNPKLNAYRRGVEAARQFIKVGDMLAELSTVGYFGCGSMHHNKRNYRVTCLLRRDCTEEVCVEVPYGG